MERERERGGRKGCVSRQGQIDNKERAKRRSVEREKASQIKVSMATGNEQLQP